MVHAKGRASRRGEEESPASGAADEDAGSPKKASRQISVERVRTLVDFVTLTSHRGGVKVVLIAPAEAMHPSAANAVLKILEEPPGDTYFLLVSHQPERLLPTIRSRCFHLTFALPDPEPTLEWLKGQGIERGELALAQGGYAPLAAIDRARDETFWSRRKALLDTLVSSEFDPLRAADCAEDIDGAVVSISQTAGRRRRRCSVGRRSTTTPSRGSVSGSAITSTNSRSSRGGSIARTSRNSGCCTT